MDVAVARARLERMLSWESDPALTSAEVDDLMLMIREPDDAGRLPDAAGWAGAWNLNRGAAEGWLWKAGKVADRFDFGSDVNDFKRDQLHKHCLEQSKQYRRGSRTLVLGAADSSLDPVIGNLNGGN